MLIFAHIKCNILSNSKDTSLLMFHILKVDNYFCLLMLPRFRAEDTKVVSNPITTLRCSQTLWSTTKCATTSTFFVLTRNRYAIRNAIQMDKRLTLRTCKIIMACGWCGSALLALLPLLGVNTYQKSAICLPLSTHSSAGEILQLQLSDLCFKRPRPPPPPPKCVCWALINNSIVFLQPTT